jgi:hypothetical protein
MWLVCACTPRYPNTPDNLVAEVDADGHMTNDSDVTMTRLRTGALLDEIIQRVNTALGDQDIDIDLFVMVPSPDVIITIGTPGSPTADEWRSVSEIVSSVVQEFIGLERVRCCPLPPARHSPTSSSPGPRRA